MSESLETELKLATVGSPHYGFASISSEVTEMNVQIKRASEDREKANQEFQQAVSANSRLLLCFLRSFVFCIRGRLNDFGVEEYLADA